MTSTKSPKFIQTAVEMLAEELVYFGNLSFEDSIELSKEIISDIDWENEALMHKGYAWIAKEYFGRQRV